MPDGGLDSRNLREALRNRPEELEEAPWELSGGSAMIASDADNLCGQGRMRVNGVEVDGLFD